jgi:Family of unknown function (DUF6677)
MAEIVQKAKTTTPPTAANLWSLSVICVLGWIIPGMGHFILKRPKQGLIFMVSIILLFIWGLHLGAKLYQYEPQQPLTFFAMLAQAGMGLPYFAVRAVANYAHAHPNAIFHAFAESFRFGAGNLEGITFEYGNTFAIVAGLLNFLVILNAYDIAVGRKKG